MVTHVWFIAVMVKFTGSNSGAVNIIYSIVYRFYLHSYLNNQKYSNGKEHMDCLVPIDIKDTFKDTFYLSFYRFCKDIGDVGQSLPISGVVSVAVTVSDVI